MNILVDNLYLEGLAGHNNCAFASWLEAVP